MNSKFRETVRKSIFMLSWLILFSFFSSTAYCYAVSGPETDSPRSEVLNQKLCQGIETSNDLISNEDSLYGQDNCYMVNVSGAKEVRPRGMPDLSSAAETLGITEEELISALGEPGQGPPDFSKAAETLGISEEELKEALGMDDDRMQGNGMPGGNRER
ncbi:MAG: hypothetical protein PQJ50_00390 [Spirochaetales bacterium]|nr:hypothetical protein [Spirochaetales bacterium]